MMAIGIGLDSFSYHRFFGNLGPKDQPTSIRWTTSDFLERAVELDVDAVSLQTAFMPKLDPHVIQSLKEKLAAIGMEAVLAWGHPTGLEGGTSPEKTEDLLSTVRAAGKLECRLVRFVAGDLFYHKIPVLERTERLIPILRKVALTAEEIGLPLAIENHGDLAMKDLVAMVERVRMDNLGICFDAMNAVRVGDNLTEALTLAAPHIRMVHVRDFLPFSVQPAAVEDFWPSAPLGRGRLEIDGFIGFLESYGYEGDLFVEMAYMHPAYPDEDAAVAESIAYLRHRLAKGKAGRGGSSITVD
ncbi:MAG: sugar phosphate isomerase/epimerase family protein [Pseudomonadota bacterium]